MTWYPSAVEAEKVALEGRNQSQDSQAILDALKAEFGAGTLSSSPQGNQIQKPNLVLGGLVAQETWSRAAPEEKKATAHEAANDVFPGLALNEITVGETRAILDIPDTAFEEPEVNHGGTEDTINTRLDDPRERLSIDGKPVLIAGRALSITKMDASQQTPTQVNADRDYAEFCQPLPSSPTDGHTQWTSNGEPRTLNPDDTGAVNFGIPSEFARPSSQVSEDGGFDNTRGHWRRPDDTSQLQPNHSFTPYKPQDLPPETPALPKNPFGAKSNGAVPFGGTQLFGQTQMLSSAVKMASPTSSRPSPNLLLNSISPNISGTSPLKHTVSSPTDRGMPSSSPTRLHEVPATVLKVKSLTALADETPTLLRARKGDLIPESPAYTTPRPSVGHRPMAHYEPMKQSQERKGGTEVRRDYSMSDSDSDNTFKKLDRKRLVEKKRAQAAAEMDKVSFIRTQQRLSEEQPGRKRRKLETTHAAVEGPMKDGGQSFPLVRDSQKSITQSAEQPSVESTKATPGDAAVSVDGQGNRADAQPDPEALDDEMIPATSPIRSSPAIHRRDAPSASEPELPALRSETSEPGRNDMDSSSLPPIRRRSQRTYGRRGRDTRTRLAVVSSAEDPENLLSGPTKQLTGEGADLEDTVVVNNAAPSSKSDSGAPGGTRSRGSAQRATSPRKLMNTDGGPPTSSSLTDMSGVPAPSSKTSPGTQESPVSDRPESVNLASPGNSVRSVRKRPRTVIESDSPQPMTKAMRLSRRTMRIHSDSTDELHRSPPATALDRSTYSKSMRSFRTSLASAPRTRKLFDGMLFALSFSENQAQRTKLERGISQAGGLVLRDGFQELFEQSATLHTSSAHDDDNMPLRLTQAGLEYGFAAVIADSHSRKAKYMQALALGLPCLAPQWTTACLKRGEIIDWTPYLLCAGASQVLGNAIRSRTLVPYSALEVTLADTLEERDKLLDGEKLLIVMDQKKARRETKQQYLFLALALGPSTVSRVSSVQQAGEMVRRAEQSGAAFNWIYADTSTGSVEDVLAAAQESGKRRRKAVGEKIGQGLRVLTDELMIQSLILGRMVEVGEME